MRVELSGTGGTGTGIQKVANAAALAALAAPQEGDFAVQLDTDTLYYYNGAAWVAYADDSDAAALVAVTTAISDHLSDTTDAPDASAISFSPVGTIAATDAQTAIAEVATDAATDLSNHVAAGDPHPAYATDTDLSNHLSDTTAAHAATAISVAPTGNLAAIEVQAALNEHQGDIDTLVTASHAAVTIGAFGGTPNSTGLSLSTQAISMQPGDETNPGGISTAAQIMGGEKRFPGGVHVGANTALGASEIFKVTSTTLGAISSPVMTTAQRDAIGTPATGLRVYNSTLKRPEFYDGTLWQSESSPNTAAAQTPADATTPTILGYRRQILPISGSGGAVSLTDLSVSNNLDGDELTLVGGSDTNTVTVVGATNTQVNGSCTLANGDTLTLVLYSAKWYEKSRSN